MINFRQVIKSDISFKRKLLGIYIKIFTITKVLLLIFIILLLFSSYLDFIKDNIKTRFLKLTTNIGFKLENLFIYGQNNVDLKDILQALDADKNTPIFAINLTNVGKRLLQNQWINYVVVKRSFPNSIHIILQEKSAIAIWQINNKLFLIDSEGNKIKEYIFEDYSDIRYDNLLHVVGIDANIHAVHLIQEFKAYQDIFNLIIASVRVGERRWDLHLKNDIIIKLPEKNLDYALSYLSKLDITNKLFNSNYKVLDLRDCDKYYIEKY